MSKKPVVDFAAPPRVNLLPAAERRRRSLLAWRDKWITAAVIALVLMVLIIGAQFFLRSSASGGLDGARAEEADLKRQIATHVDIVPMVAERDRVLAQREQALSGDMDWSAPATLLGPALPAGAAITGFDGVVGSTYTGKPDAIGLKSIVTVESSKPIDQAAVLDSFGLVKNVIAVDMLGLQQVEQVYQYRIFVLFSQEIYSNQFMRDQTGATS